MLIIPLGMLFLYRQFHVFCAEVMCWNSSRCYGNRLKVVMQMVWAI